MLFRSSNVTIFGESAGSFSVHHMMATKHAKGLFHRAIGQSGSSLGPMIDIRRKDNASHALAMKLQEKLKANSLAELKEMDASDILSGSSGLRFRPVLDGDIFEDQIHTLFQNGDYSPVPLMVGFNADEGTTLGAARFVPKDRAT